MDKYEGLDPFVVYGWMPYAERMRRISLGVVYWLAMWDEAPELMPTLA